MQVNEGKRGGTETKVRTKDVKGRKIVGGKKRELKIKKTKEMETYVTK